MRLGFCFTLFLTVLLAALLTPGISAAQQRSSVTAAPPAVAAPPAPVDAALKLPDRILRPMRAIDQQTLRAEGVTIRLWGIMPAQTYETPIALKALDVMDHLIQEQLVNCKIMGGVMPELIGRCATQNNQDLALELLSRGFAIVDRQQTYDSVFATGYEKAQEAARLNGRGVWALVNREERADPTPKWLQPYMGFVVPLAMILGPLLGLLVIAVIAHRWLRAIAFAQQAEADQIHAKETALEARERQVLVTTLEVELAENKNKIEAFLVIYGDMLRSLQDTSEEPKYRQVGDIVQKHPNYSKTVFEANVNKLSLLDIKLAGRLSKLYAQMPRETEYINLDQNVPLETAVKLIEKVLRETEELLAPVGELIKELQELPLPRS